MKLRGCIVCIFLVVAGCASVPSFSPPSEESLRVFQQRERLLEKIHSWELSGRVAVQSSHGAWNGNLHWVKTPGSFDIRLSTPLGQSVFLLHDDRHETVLHLSDGATYYDDNAENILDKQLGWRLPINNLQYWILGRFAPNTKHSLLLNEHGFLEQLRQSGWDVQIKRYTHIDDVDLPSKMFFGNGSINVRLVIDEWAVNN